MGDSLGPRLQEGVRGDNTESGQTGPEAKSSGARITDSSNITRAAQLPSVLEGTG